MRTLVEQSKKKLRIVEPRHELSGKFPRRFERAARSSVVGDPTHRGLLFVTTTLARRGVRECLPPSCGSESVEFCRLVEQWAAGRASLTQVKAARRQAFEAAGAFELRTLEVLKRALQPATDEPFDEHADRVCLRYVGLAVHHAVTAIVHCCDGVLDPLVLLEVPKEVAAAIAYRNVALGAARSAQVRSDARANAEWESERVYAVASHDPRALAVQLLHEYLGVHWKNHVDAQRIYLEQFLEWAVPAEA